MSKKSKVSYQLNNTKGQIEPSEEDIKNILRAADEIIFVGGRTMLAKILKGSKDKKLLEKQLELCPSYGYFNKLTIEEITKIIDWMIINNYLDIDYNGRLPMIVFSSKGWENYKPVYMDELYNKILNVGEDTREALIEELTKTNREVISMLLFKIGSSKNISFIKFLIKWETVEVKKVRQKINAAILKLKSI
ncbi:DNA helicase II [Clostridiaceae bacterium UIB06]|uniref:DNA helicase II n=1 Tax=Clostridium thailandense TaxID=2794346 RepID=A0A949X2X1_9CLOT|nr:RQC-minor-1 family DNA-binding protein [Clostridium thailandense]MBV7273769.1 DNA helicase II [Clostridium thailandense]MCH5137451.1 DNA helicase II [Clostridiaceae bacterium UIB06]